MNLEIKIKQHKAFFVSETERILTLIRKNGTRFDIYQTNDGITNQYILEQEIKTIVSNNFIVPEILFSEYPLPYLSANIIASMIKDRILAEPETFIVD